MQFDFEFKEFLGEGSDCLIFESADGLKLEIYFSDYFPSTFMLAGNEFEILSDDYKGLYVRAGTGLDAQMVPISKVIDEAYEKFLLITADEDGQHGREFNVHDL